MDRVLGSGGRRERDGGEELMEANRIGVWLEAIQGGVNKLVDREVFNYWIVCGSFRSKPR